MNLCTFAVKKSLEACHTTFYNNIHVTHWLI